MVRALVVLAAIASCRRDHRDAPDAPPYRTQIVFLGTGTPSPDPDRAGPATAIVVDGVAYLFDCGPGVVRRAAAAAKRLAIDGLLPKQLGHVFITHLHSDHTLGYPDLLWTPWIVGRKQPLEVYGPPGIAVMTEHLEQAWAEDLEIRIHGLEHEDAALSRPNVHEITAGVVYQDARVKITAVPVHHGSWKTAYGYRVDGPDRSVVITGDYAPPGDALVAACDGCDVLVSEVYATKDGVQQPADWIAYLAAFHISATQLGELATQAKAKQLVITHWVNAQRSSEPALLDELQAKYAGRVRVARDLDRL